NGHPEHRQRRKCRSHAWQMRSSTGTRNDNLEALVLGALGKLIEPIGRAMGGYNPDVVRNLERFQRLCGMPHGFPVRLAAHDYGNVDSSCIHMDVTFLAGWWSGNDVRYQTVFYLLQTILQREFFLFHALNLQGIAACRHHRIDGGVEIGMLLFEAGTFQAG